MQQVGQRQQPHTLMMCHEGPHDHAQFSAAARASRVVHGVVVSEISQQSDGGHATKVGNGAPRRQAESQHGGVGRNHQLLRQVALRVPAPARRRPCTGRFAENPGRRRRTRTLPTERVGAGRSGSAPRPHRAPPGPAGSCGRCAAREAASGIRTSFPSSSARRAGAQRRCRGGSWRTNARGVRSRRRWPQNCPGAPRSPEGHSRRDRGSRPIRCIQWRKDGGRLSYRKRMLMP